jgi:hypothetical protein
VQYDVTVPTVSDRALQRSTGEVLSAIYEQDFLSCSFGGRPKRGAHHALATLIEVIAGGKTGWVLEADLKNFFGSLDHEWVLRFIEHRVGDPRLISLIRRWLKAGVLEDGEVHPSEQGTPQGGSISVLLSNVYLHYVLDLWFERVVKVRLRGEAHLVRYIDDFVICFQYRSAAQPYVSAGADAGNTPSCDQRPGRRIKCRPTRPLCLLRRRRKYPGAVQGVPGRGALLAQDVVQPQLGRPRPNVGRFPPDQRTDTATATKTAAPLPEAAGACSAVNQLPKSVVR